MQVEVTIKLETGEVLSGILVSKNEVGTKAAAAKLAPNVTTPQPLSSLEFSLPLRPFMVQNAAKMSGSKKFALLVAYHAKGETDVPVERGLLIEQWNKMTGLLGGKFNGAHESRAKDAGWIYVPDSGNIALLRNWEQILL